MKSKFTALICFTLIMVMGFSLAGCSKQSTTQKENKTIKIGATAVFEPLVRTLKEGLAVKGYNTEVVLFDANNMPAIATRDGDINGFIQNHRPWLETFNKENNANLTIMEPYLFYSRSALYSTKHKSLADFPNGAKIAVPNDPTNLQESLLFLQKLELLTLKPKTDKFYTVLDIAENPKNIKIIETELTTTARNINDADAVICPASRIKAAGIDPNSFLAEDMTKANFPLGLTIDAKSVNEPWVKDAMEILASDAIEAVFTKEYSGTLVPYNK